MKNSFARSWDSVQAKVRRHGLLSWTYGAVVKGINRFVPFKVLRTVYVEEAHADFLAVPAGYSAGILPSPDLRDFAGDPQHGMSEAFVGEALGKGDECYGFTSGGALAAYGWYATNATAVLPGLVLQFSPRYVYMYKGFTSDLHRGKRLHAIGMTRALEHYRTKGYDGIVSYIESTNFDSLKSCARMGYRVFGSIYVVKLFGRYFTLASPGCARFAMRLTPVAQDARPESIAARLFPTKARATRG